jgi:hypothetical protein
MDSSSQQKKRKPSGRPQSEVWKHYEKTPLKSSPGHFSAKCNYCKNVWTRGHVHELEDHLANKCKESPEIVSSFYLGVITSRDFGDQDDTVPLSEKNKKRKTQSNQRELTDWFDSTDLPSQKAASITRSLVRVFACCGISFSIVESPFFIEFLHEMRPGYVSPSRDVLSGRLLSQETSRINEKVNNVIKNSQNLTLGE